MDAQLSGMIREVLTSLPAVVRDGCNQQLIMEKLVSLGAVNVGLLRPMLVDTTLRDFVANELSSCAAPVFVAQLMGIVCADAAVAEVTNGLEQGSIDQQARGC